VKMVGYIAGGVLGVVMLIVLAFALELGGLEWKRFFAPKHEAVRREVFKGTRSYNESKTQDLARYRLQYLQSNNEGRKAIVSTINIMFADYDAELLPVELAAFLKKVRGY